MWKQYIRQLWGTLLNILCHGYLPTQNFITGIWKEGDNIIEKDIVNIVSNAAASSEKAISAEESPKSPDIAGGQEIGKDAGNQKLDDDVKEITIKVNSQEVIMKGKNKYIFIDVFNYIQFDRTRVKGTLILKLNGNHAGYNDELKDKDVVEIYWQQNGKLHL